MTIAREQLKLISELLDEKAIKPIGNAELTAWRRNMLGKPFRLFKNGQFVRRFKALDLEDAISLLGMGKWEVIGEYAYQFPYELLEVL